MPSALVMVTVLGKRMVCTSPPSVDVSVNELVPLTKFTATLVLRMANISRRGTTNRFWVLRNNRCHHSHG